MMLPWLQRPAKIAVIGDLILDEYWQGSVNRISPEAPVPVHHVQRIAHHLGGAANTALNIQKVGGQAFLFGVWGADEAARILAALLKAAGIDSHGVVEVSERPTVRKTRITSGVQQMIRVDQEQAFPLEVVHQKALLKQLEALPLDAFLLSDYGKGVLPSSFVQALIQLAKKKKIPVVVDPKGRDFHRYQGATLITPNVKEALVALGLEEETGPYTGEYLGRELQKKFGLDAILLTMGAEGMLYVPRESSEASVLQQTRAREVFDVSGAGDTVAAVMALALASHVAPTEAIYLATIAAGKVVEKWGTQPILQEELEARLVEGSSVQEGTARKMMTREAMIQMALRLHEKKKKIVFTNGCFDLMHVGHVTYLEQARQLGDVLVIGVNTDDSVQKLKGPHRPIIPLKERMRMLAGLECVGYVVSFSESTPLSLIEQVMPDVLVKGADYQEHQIVGADFVKKRGGSVQCIEFVPGWSSSRMIEKILAAEGKSV